MGSSHNGCWVCLCCHYANYKVSILFINESCIYTSMCFRFLHLACIRIRKNNQSLVRAYILLMANYICYRCRSLSLAISIIFKRASVRASNITYLEFPAVVVNRCKNQLIQVEVAALGFPWSVQRPRSYAHDGIPLLNLSF